MAEDEALRVIGAAYADFDSGRYDEVLERLGELPDGGGPLGVGLRLASEALSLEREDPDAAGERMEEALVLATASPLLLGHIARFFERNGRHALAYVALGLHGIVAPEPMERFLADVPRAERARYAPWALAASPWTERQRYDAMVPYKSALRERFGPDAAAVLLADMGIGGQRRVVRRRTLVGLMAYAAEHGQDYEVIVSDRPIPASVTHLFGDEDISYERRGRTILSCTLRNVVVPAKSDVLLAGDVALLDFQADELSRRQQDLARDPLIAAEDGDSVLTLESPTAEVRETIDQAIWLTGAYSRSFDHWAFEYLPRLWAQLGRPGFDDVPVLLDDEMPRQHLESVRLFAGADHPIIVLRRSDSVRVSRLWVATRLGYEATSGPSVQPMTRSGIDAEGFERLMKAAGPVLDAVRPASVAERIYLVGGGSRHYELVNADELETILASRGYQPRDLGRLSFVEQLRVIRGAEHVVGTAGPALAMTIFGRPGLGVGVLAPPERPGVEWLSGLSSALGHDLTIVSGQAAQDTAGERAGRRYHIDPATLTDYLDSRGPVPAGMPETQSSV